MATRKPLAIIAGKVKQWVTGDKLPYDTLPTGTGANTVAAGNDARLSDAREWAASTVDQAEAEAGTGTTRRAWTSQRVRQAIAAWWNTITDIDGKNIGATSPATGRFTTLTMTGNAAIGSSTNPAHGLGVFSSGLSGTAQAGVVAWPIGNASATAAVDAMLVRAQTLNVAFTTGRATGVTILDATRGAASTITNQHGVFVTDQTQGVNNYGITSQVSAGTNKRNLNITGTADNVLMGPLHVGATSARQFELAGGATAGAAATVNIERTGSDPDLAGITITRNSSGTSNYGPNITLARSNAPTLGAVTAVIDGSRLGGIAWAGADGTDTRPKAAEIHAIVSGTVASNSVPGDLIFGTTQAGGVSPTERLRITSTGTVRPGADNTQSLGDASFRWGTVFAGTGTIITSDAREKTPVAEFNLAEISAAKQLSKEIGIYKFLDSVAAKGDAARKHTGLTVQRAIEIMEDNGLDPFSYGFICCDEWEQQAVEHPAIEAVEAQEAWTETIEHDAELDGEGNVVKEAWTEAIEHPAIEGVEAKEAWTEVTKEAGDRYGFRYDQLNMFIARGIEARLAALEAA